MSIQSDIRFTRAIPILRIFDEVKAREFYLDFLGFNVEFEHRFEPSLPLYMGIERAGLNLHLSEHHGDACPGSTVYVPMLNIEGFRDELLARQYGYARPGIEEMPWGKSWKCTTRSATVFDSMRDDRNRFQR